MIVADIIESALSHTLEDMALLGALVIIRTALSYFLGRELKEVSAELESVPSGPGS